MDTLLLVVVCFGLSAVGLCFLVLMPTVAHLISGLWGAVVAEQLVAKMRGVPSGIEPDAE